MATLTGYNAAVDDDFQLEDAAAAITASGAGSTIIDLGAGVELMLGDIFIAVSALDTVTGNEGYRINLEGSMSATFASGVVELCDLSIGGATDARVNGDVLATVGNYALPFRTEQDDVNYRYLRLFFVLSGTTPSITCTAWGVKRHD